MLIIDAYFFREELFILCMYEPENLLDTMNKDILYVSFHQRYEILIEEFL